MKVYELGLIDYLIYGPVLFFCLAYQLSFALRVFRIVRCHLLATSPLARKLKGVPVAVWPTRI